MPSKSKAQANLMSAIAHGWRPPQKHAPSLAVAKEFHEADKREGKWEHSYADGGKVSSVGRILDVLAQKFGEGLYGENSKSYNKLLQSTGWNPQVSSRDFDLFHELANKPSQYLSDSSKNDLQSLFEKYPLTMGSNYLTHRGLVLPKSAADGIQPGSVLRRDLPQSVTPDRDTAMQFALNTSSHPWYRGKTEVPTLLNISHKPGAKVLPQPLSGQSELLLPPDAPLKVSSSSYVAHPDYPDEDSFLSAYADHTGFAEGGKVEDAIKLASNAIHWVQGNFFGRDSKIKVPVLVGPADPHTIKNFQGVAKLASPSSKDVYRTLEGSSDGLGTSFNGPDKLNASIAWPADMALHGDMMAALGMTKGVGFPTDGKVLNYQLPSDLQEGLMLRHHELRDSAANRGGLWTGMDSKSDFDSFAQGGPVHHYAEGGPVAGTNVTQSTLDLISHAADRATSFLATDPHHLLARAAAGLASQVVGQDDQGRPQLGRVPGIVKEALAVPAGLADIGTAGMGTLDSLARRARGTAAGRAVSDSPMGAMGAGSLSAAKTALDALRARYGSDLAPAWSRSAESDADSLHRSTRAAMGLSAPRGTSENLAEAAGTMLGQIPLGAEKAGESTLAKLAKSPMEWLGPTIRPSAANYGAGTLAGGLMGAAAGDPQQ